MDLKLKDKVVAITGGTTGIGLACAFHFGCIQQHGSLL